MLVTSAMKRMKRIVILSMCILAAGLASAQEMFTPEGVSMLSNKSFDNSGQARQEILALYQDLCVTDVLDGMDLIGLQDIGLMHNDMRPLWRDPDEFSHRVLGFAVTVRYLPTDVRVGQHSFERYEDYEKWKRQQYGRASNAGWVAAGKPGEVVVMVGDQKGRAARYRDLGIPLDETVKPLEEK